MMSQALQRAMNAISQEIAPDAEWADGEEMAELVLDASRLEVAGYTEEAAEASRLISEHGYPAVLKEGAKHVYTY